MLWPASDQVLPGWLGLGFQAGLDAKQGEQAVRLETDEIGEVKILHGLERSLQQAHRALREQPLRVGHDGSHRPAAFVNSGGGGASTGSGRSLTGGGAVAR